MIIAKSEKFRNHFIAEMQERKIKKNYIGVVSGIPSLGSFEINLPIGRDKKSRIKMAVRDDGRDAISIVSLKDKFKNYSMLDISIETGRTHQIRVHLAYNKLPLIGDRTYNPRAIIQKDSSAEAIKLIREFPRQALHAHTIRFRSIDNDDELTFSAPLANDISELVKNLKTFA
jgi:23S rRNA pseudouridine1911/1915/1917 synthase